MTFAAGSELQRDEPVLKYRVVFRPEAHNEAVDAAAYMLVEGYGEAALEWYARLEEAVASLASMPARCPLAREHASFPGIELRQLLVKPYRLILVIRNDEVHVLHVRHVSRADIDELEG